MSFPFGKLFSVFSLITLAGCAGASVAQQTQNSPSSSARPSQIVVYPFAIDSSEVTLNQSIIQRAYRNVSGDQDAQQQSIAHDTAQEVCLKIVTGLKDKGYDALCQERGIVATGDNLLIVDGEFTDISEGNRLRRLVIGFGAGASTLDTSVTINQVIGAASYHLLQFTTHADSGKMPGAVVMGPAGAAAGGGAGTVVAANAAVGGAKSYTSATGFLADKTATQIVDYVTGYFAQHGWAS